MYGDNIIELYKLSERSDPSSYKKFEGYIKQYVTAETYQALQEMISIYNSPILKWERFKEHINRRKSMLEFGQILGSAEKAIYTAVENGERVNIQSELEKALENYRNRLIRKSID